MSFLIFLPILLDKLLYLSELHVFCITYQKMGFLSMNQQTQIKKKNNGRGIMMILNKSIV